MVVLYEPYQAVYGRHVRQPHPAASLAKVPLVAAVLQAGDAERLDLDGLVRVADLDRTVAPNILEGLSGETLSVRSVAALAITTSSNPAASYLLRLVGQRQYRAVLTSAGCERTGTPIGFADTDFNALAACETTALDQSRILDYVWAHPAMGALQLWMANNVLNHRLSARLEYPDVMAHKTGTLAGAVHDIGMWTTPGVRASIVALTSTGTDSAEMSWRLTELWPAVAGALKEGAGPGSCG